jgi:hypothetical protein
MNETDVKSFSPESINFRRLSKPEKYAKLLKFCVESNRTPSTSNVTEDERVLGQFYTNSKSALKNDKLTKWEITELDKVYQYSSKRETRIDKLNRILKYCEANGKTPSQSSKNIDEKKLGQLLNTIKNSAKRKPLTSDELNKFDIINKYRSNYQRSRSEKLHDVLAFCEKYDRTPKQHVNNINEKQYAEFLSTTRILYTKGTLDEECKRLLKLVNAYSPMNRTEKIRKLRAFAEKHKIVPKMNSNSLEERQLATFFTKMKSTMKRGKLKPDEHSLMTEVMKLCKVKTRLEKIKDLHAYTISMGRLPKLNTNDEKERKFAMFFNNIKQARKNNRLKSDELDALHAVETSHRKTHTSFA